MKHERKRRKESLFSRTQMEVMDLDQLKELLAIGSTYEQLQAQAIMSDRRSGNTKGHGSPSIYEPMASTKGQRSVTGIPVKPNRYANGHHQNRRAKHAYRISKIDDPSIS